MIKPWILYARVSTGGQHNENQEIRLKEWAKLNSVEYEYYSEKESTRKTRPIKAKVLSLLRTLRYEGVVVVKMDRWARSTQELSTEVKELYDKGVTFKSLNENIDLGSANGKLQFNIFASFAEFERDLIRDRTNEGLARARAEGKRLGRPKGSKDKKRRRKSGYYQRYAGG